ncbi:MAG: radical SAM protein [Oscillospiraceae bacterium]|nr:radical SAM protein [Oscillospiraceae bacterium]
MAELCTLCPRACGADREAGNTGFCSVAAQPVVARAALHFWEEPCISGERGSGTVFFSGCTLRCVYCQNAAISRGRAGKPVSVQRLADIFLELQQKGAHNINLVTPDHFARPIAEALSFAKQSGLRLPIVVNTGGYLSAQAFSLLAPHTDIWLTDFKYMSAALGKKYSAAEDYPAVAKAALERMVQHAGAPQFDEEGMMRRGVIVRLLLLPGELQDAQAVVQYVWQSYGENVILSLMNQYTPPAAGVEQFSNLQRTVTAAEYDALCDFALDLGIETAFVQEEGPAEESFIPPFDLEGV